MNLPVEAQSISSLGNLLANPPRYPRNPTHEIHDRLVLYIVRVPGSKDVFLTPLKPPTKASISIEAVQSCLYYLHVERPEDDEVRQSLEVARAVDNKENTPLVHRKPLPVTPFANYPASQRPPTPPKSYPHFQPPLPGSDTASQTERYAARGANLRLSSPERSDATTAARKPIGARPMPARPEVLIPFPTFSDESTASPTSPDNASAQTRVTRKPVQSASAAIDFSAVTEKGISSAPAQMRPPPLPIRTSSYDKQTTSPQSGTIQVTLIRRDPASGSQWNIGTITQSHSTMPLREVEVELTTPGYLQFAKADGTGSSFQRKVAHMSMSQGSSSLGARARSNSTESYSVSRKRARQAYAFLSPWQGMCAFSNGIDGKSLRCRHSLPGANPALPSIVNDVAELRFNLPWTPLRLRDPGKRTDNELSELPVNTASPITEKPPHREWRKSFQDFKHKARQQMSENDGLSMRPMSQNPSLLDQVAGKMLSLDLGRERAGGGFKGHSAKLGKLIINDEGLKMCDLVVSACMGVWWQHYASDASSW